MDNDRWLQDGFERFKAGDFDGAVQALERALELDPADPAVLRTLAMSWFRKDEFARGLPLAERLVEVAPNDPISFTTLSIFLMKNGRIEEAEAASARAKVLTWKRQLKDGPGGSPSLTVIDAKSSTSPPILPTVSPPILPVLPKRPAAPPLDAPAKEPSDPDAKS